MDDATILRDRARQLAKPLQEDREGTLNGEVEVVIFQLGHEKYALETVQVREVFPVRDITSVPGTPPWLLGIINVRGRILAVLDLPYLLGLEASVTTTATQRANKEDNTQEPVLILRGDLVENAGDVALSTEGIVGVSVLREREIEAAHALSGAPGARYLRGLTSSHISLLDATLLLSDAQLLVQDE